MAHKYLKRAAWAKVNWNQSNQEIAEQLGASVRRVRAVRRERGRPMKKRSVNALYSPESAVIEQLTGKPGETIFQITDALGRGGLSGKRVRVILERLASQGIVTTSLVTFYSLPQETP